ncbi:MAG: SlyX family protein [Rhizobiaceae bacterium]
MSEQRLQALEEMTAHQARTIDELSQEMASQGEALRIIERKLDVLAKRFAALEETASPDVPVTRPPHW